MLEDNAFPGDSEMAQRLRQFQWTNSELGDPGSWPQSLRSVVRLLVQSRYPMFLWWGEDCVQLYNDAYIPLLGSRHPEALCRPAAQTWTDVWDVIGPQARDVMRHGVGTWNERMLLVMTRHGYTEEAYFTYSYSPVYNDAGEIGGMFCAVSEETERVVNERRLAALAALASGTVAWESERQASERAITALAPFTHDLPFVLLFEVNGEQSSLVSATRAGLDGKASTGEGGQVDWNQMAWPLEAATSTGWELVDDLPSRGLRVTAGPWPELVTTAAVVPLAGTDRAGVKTVLVVGLSPRLRVDLAYRRFVELVASQFSKALTDARRVEHERRRAAELAELDRAKTIFFSNVSHELRTPLTLILGPLEELARHVPSDAVGSELLVTARRNAQRLLRLVNTLLDFARIESGRINAHFAPTDLGSFTTDLASNFRSVCELAGLNLVVECPPLGVPVFVDRQLWEKIVLNLLSNALKFTLDGYVAIRLRERATPNGGAVAELVVEDSGVGIAEVNIPRLFRRFERIEGTRGRSYEGSGIGLSLVAELVQVHGGRIAVQSELDKGTRFIVTVPFGSDHLPAGAIVEADSAGDVDDGVGAASKQLYVAEALQWLEADEESPSSGGAAAPTGTGGAGVEASEPSEPSPGSEPTEGRELESERPRRRGASARHLLIVDDNPDMRRHVQRIVGGVHRVTLARDGESAWRCITADAPDLVITDLMMPGLDGYGLIARIRADDALHSTPIIALSARAGEEARVEGLNLGADDYLVKPFAASELSARVNAQLRLADAVRERARLLESEQRARAEAESQRRQLRALFDQAPTLIALFRGENHVVELANALICRSWGKRQEEMLGRPFLEAVPEGRDQSWRPLLDDVYRTGEPFIGREFEAQFERDGRWETSYYDFVYAPLREESAVSGVIVVATDVTQQVLARKELSGLREAAETANRAKDEFLAMLGHELRNPLAPITTALELLKMRGVEAAERERAIIERQVRHLVTLVDDLLDVSRITRGKVELKRSFVELADVVGKAIEMASPLLEQQRHELSVEVSPSGLGLFADPNRLAQVVSNVLTNSAKYTEPGGRVHVSAHLEEGDVVLQVRDSGVGIAPEMLPHVFDLFAQERQTLARSRGGLGLGLTIVRSLVVLHGGTVTAESDGIGRGASFTIRLPHAAKSSVSAASPTTTTSFSDASDTAQFRVLVVDDNVDAADMLAEFLERFGYSVRAVHDGPAALEVVGPFQPNVALVDIGLPVMDGYELAHRLRRHPGLDGLRLVAVTGYGQAKDRERSTAAGFHAHLVKPLDMAELRETLAKLTPSVSSSAPM